MRKFIYTIPFLFLFCCNVNAQQEDNTFQDSVSVTSDSGSGGGDQSDSIDIFSNTDTTIYFHQLTISPDSVNKWKAQKAFAYAKNLDSLLNAKQNENVTVQRGPSGPSWFDRLFNSLGTKVFFWILAIAFVVFILYKLFLTQGVFSKVVKTNTLAAPKKPEEKITNDSDFDGLIQKALAGNDYRLAVRYQYLKTLYRLAQKAFIVMAVDKTNYQYVREISNAQLRNEFASLTLSYEYVWYGEFAIEENIYQKIAAGFSTFNPKV